MKTNLKEINSYTRQLDITIAWNLIEADYQNEFKKACSRYSIPGFRKGKVPEKIVKKHLGQSIEANFAEHSINTYYRKALDELQLLPINQATINDLNFQEGLDLSFSAQFEIEPELKLPKYQRKFKIKTVRYKAENEDIKIALTQYQEEHATIKTIDSGAETGNFIKGDFEILDEGGLPTAEKKLENQYIRLGFGLFKDDAEKVFLGAKEGDEITVTISGKEKPVTYCVTISRVEEQILPDLDDELAKTVNENTSTLEELKQLIKDQIQTSLDKDHKDVIQKEIINYFVENSEVEAPDSMVKRYLDQIKDDMEKRKQPFDEKKLEENYNSHAEWNIKWYLLKDLLIKNEGLEVSDEEINGNIDEFILKNKEDRKMLKSFYHKPKNRKLLHDRILDEKLFVRLSKFAKVKVVEESTNELRKKQAA